jgi:hypothetical protein
MVYFDSLMQDILSGLYMRTKLPMLNIPRTDKNTTKAPMAASTVFMVGVP